MLQDGIYFNLNEDEYHKDLALGSTNLKMLLGNPEDYWYDKFKEARAETPALTYGRQIHKCILEGVEAFSETYASYEGNLNTKAGKEAFELAKATGKTPIKLDEFNKILSVNTQIKQDPSIDKIFKKGIAEISVIWTDEKTGIRFKARFDYLRKNSIIDLKTLSNPNNKPMHIAVKDAIAGFKLYSLCRTLY
ncbi:MAG: PD-(D/E)XK nuclease-like domain-containing protein [Alphaproteobacteria bacterium]|nr:PD-(D/E)XK nuclease-like domain-containing protein [Alphaproteobacteria bacterium]